MANSKRGITRDSVFGNFGFGKEKTIIKQGLPNRDIQTRQTAVWLSGEEEQWLDDKCAEIKKSGWRGVSRSAIIRSIIQAVREQDINVEGVTGEAELIQRIASK